MSSNVVDEVIEKMAMAIAADHISAEDRSEYSWDAADKVFRRSFRQKARRYLKAGLVGLALPGDTIAPSAITEVEQLADDAEKPPSPFSPLCTPAIVKKEPAQPWKTAWLKIPYTLAELDCRHEIGRAHV